MNTNAINNANLIKAIPIKKGIKKSAVHHILSYMAAWTDINTNEFYLSYSQIAKGTFLDKSVVIKTRDWIEQLGLIKDTGRRAGALGKTIIYKFTYEFNITTDAAILIAHHSKNRVSPLKNMRKNKTKAPEQQILLSEISDTLLSEISDTLLSEISDTKEEPKKTKKTSCVKPLPIIQEQPTEKEEGEDGFNFLKSKLKRSNKIAKIRYLSKKHSLRSLQCYHQELLNDIEDAKKQNRALTIGVLLHRLDTSDEWIGMFPVSVKRGNSKQTAQTAINLTSEYIQQNKLDALADPVENFDAGAEYKKMIANLG